MPDFFYQGFVGGWGVAGFVNGAAAVYDIDPALAQAKDIFYIRSAVPADFYRWPDVADKPNFL